MENETEIEMQSKLCHERMYKAMKFYFDDTAIFDDNIAAYRISGKGVEYISNSSFYKKDYLSGKSINEIKD